MDLSKIFVDRPILAAVLSLFVFIAGLVAIPNLPISEYPEVVPPSVQVFATYPGADPQTISETVAAPLEEAINGVENMIYMKSVAGSDGQMQLTVTFRGGTDIDLASVLVQNRVARALPRLPESVRALGVTTEKSSPSLTMVVHLRSPNGRYDSLYLSNYATLRVRDELARLQGVGQALIFGENRSYNVALIVPDFDALGLWAAAEGIEVSDRESLVGDSRVRELFRAEIEAYSTEAKRYERVRDFVLAVDDFRVDNGLLTPTLKLKRKAVLELYLEQLEKLYGD